MRKIWPSEDNYSKLVRNSHNTFSLCEIRTTPSACVKFAQHLQLVRNSHQPMWLWCEISSILPTPHEIFSYVFFDVNSFLIPVISQSQALLCKDYKKGGNHLSTCVLRFTLSEIQSSLVFLFSLLFSFSWKPNNLWGCFPRGWEAKPLVSWSEGS